jgi:hypothetical protein
MQMLDFANQGYIDVGEHGPMIYKVMRKLGLSRLWEPLSSANENTQRVTRDEFTKVFLSWLGIGEQFELSAMNQGMSHHTCFVSKMQLRSVWVACKSNITLR